MKFAKAYTSLLLHLEGRRNYDPFILPLFYYILSLILVNNNSMLLSIHHPAHGHLLFIKLIILSGRAIIILYPNPSPSSFHQDPVNIRRCRPQRSSTFRPIRVDLKYPGVCICSRAPFISAAGEEGRMVICQTMGQSRAKAPSTEGNGVGRSPLQRRLDRGL